MIDAIVLAISVECLAKNIFFEARDQNWAGQIAVAEVTLNRVDDPRFPDSVCGVVYQSYTDDNGFPLRNRCQFSWYCDGLPDRISFDREYYEKILALSYHILEEPEVANLTQGATHYHSDKVDPYWASTLEKTVVIGNHIFYRWE